MSRQSHYIPKKKSVKNVNLKRIVYNILGNYRYIMYNLVSRKTTKPFNQKLVKLHYSIFIPGNKMELF